jgi:hypothetical protein
MKIFAASKDSWEWGPKVESCGGRPLGEENNVSSAVFDVQQERRKSAKMPRLMHIIHE